MATDRVGAAGRILNAEYLDVVAQFAERSGCGGASQTRTDDDDVELAPVSYTHLDVYKRQVALGPPS